MSSPFELSAPQALQAKEAHYGAVCQILKKEEGKQVDAGTGFLIGHRLLLTCEHVVQTTDKIEEYSANFNYSMSTERCFVAKFEEEQNYPHSPSPGNNAPIDGEHLDFRILHLKDHPALKKIAKCAFTKITTPEVGDRANVIHHALHEDPHPTRFPGLKQFARGNPISKVKEDGTIHYTTATINIGASGAPIFDDEGNLLAVHRGEIHNSQHENCLVGVSIARIFESFSVEDKARIQKARDEAERLATVQHKINNMYLPPSDFTGREKALKVLEQRIKERRRVVVTGLGGVGKTALALQFVYLHQHEYEHTYFLRANTPEMLRSNLISLAEELGLPKTDKVEERLHKLKVQLDRMGESILILIDGIDDSNTFEELQKHLPNQACVLLLTSRQVEEAKKLDFLPIKLKSMNIDDAVNFLIKAAENDTNHTQAKILAEKLGGLPLALKHAAAYIRETPRYTFEKYIQDFNELSVEVFEGEEFKFLSQEEKTVLTTWNITTTAIKKLAHGELALEVLDLFSCLAEAPIPMDLCENVFKEIPPRSLDKALRHLKNYGVIGSEDETLTIHSLVQKVTCHHLSSDSKGKLYDQVLETARDFAKNVDLDEFKNKPLLDLYMPHMEKLEKSINFKQTSLEQPENVAYLLKVLWHSNYHNANYSKALELSQREYDHCKTQLREKRLFLANASGRLGLSLGELGRHEEALAYIMEALEQRRTILGECHPSVAASLNDIGVTLGELGRYEEALAYKMESLELDKTLLGKSHPSVAASLNNVGSTLGALGRHEEALVYQMESLELFKTLLGASHPHVAASLNNVGHTLGRLGRHEEALKYKMEALELFKTLLGASHPDVASSLNNVGYTLGNLGRHEEALKYKMEALELFKTLLGATHPHVAASLNNVGHTLGRLGRHEEALAYQMESLELLKTLLGASHPHVATSLNNVGMSLGELGRHEEAFAFLKEALELRKTLLGESHPHTAMCLNNVGSALEALGRYKEAWRHFFESVDILEEKLGGDHPQTKNAYMALAQCLSNFKINSNFEYIIRND